jgi:inner membrane protein
MAACADGVDVFTGKPLPAESGIRAVTMPSPIGHSLMGYVIYRAAAHRVTRDGWSQIGLCVLAANVPDLDFVPGLLVGDLSHYHHGPSHSLFFGFVFALVVSIFCSRRLHMFLIVSSLYCSHVLLDYLVRDPSFPHGVPLFWPFADEYYMASFAFLSGVQYQRDAAESIQQLFFSKHNVLTMFMEVLVLSPLLVLTFVRDKKIRERPEHKTGALRL